MDSKGHQSILKYLQSIAGRQAFHHAYIFAAPSVVPTKEVAQKFAQMLYCREASGSPCSACIHCRQLETLVHPDVLVLSAEEGKHAISIKQVRALQSHLQQSPSVAPYTIGIIERAHEMSIAASNALLKTLEEPSSTSLMILLTHTPDDLLPTIRSRSQILEFADNSSQIQQIDPQEVSLFTSLYSSSKGAILEQLDELFSSKKKHKEEKDVWYKRFSLWKTLLHSMIMVKLGQEVPSIVSDNNLSLQQLQKSIDGLSDLQHKLSQNVNTRLHLEAYFIDLLT